MKIFLPITFLLASVCVQAQVLLFDQTSNPNGGTACQDFETANDIYDCKIAEDFTIPTGPSWYIDSIKLFGTYSATATLNSGLLLDIYTDNSGQPGTLITGVNIPSNADPDNDGSLNAPFSTPVSLSPGTYWIVAQARKDFGTGGQWYWGRDSVGSGYNFLWQNSGNGFGTGCTGWTAATSCTALNVTDEGTRFRIWGCYGPKPTLELGNDTILCSDATPWTVEPESVLSNLIYYWNTDDTATSIDVDTTGHYVAYAYDPTTQCAAMDDITIEVFENPVADLEDDTICQGNIMQYNGFSGCALCQYIWDDTVSGTYFYSTTVAGWHSLEIIDPNSGCAGRDSAWLEVQSTDPPVLVPGTEIDLCEGDSVYLTTADPYAEYHWSTLETTPGIMIYDGGPYSVTVETSAGCQSHDTAVVNLRLAPVPSITIDTTVNWKIRLTASMGYQAYLWNDDQTDPVIIANSTGDYSVTVTDEFGCEGSITIHVEVTGIEGIVAEQMEIYPNPAHEYLNINWPQGWVGKASLDVVDISGRSMKTLKAAEASQRLELSGMSAGYYLVRIHSPQGEGIIRLVVE